MKKIKMLMLAFIAGFGFMFTGCSDDAYIASANLSKAADNFEITRRIVFYNGITGEYMLSIEGKCSQEHVNEKFTVTCKTGNNEYKKHFLGLSDNVTYFSEQMEAANVSVYHYRVTFKPQSIINDIDFKGSADSLIKAVTPDNKD